MCPKTNHSNEFYTALPKVELHRHLEGSVRFDTLVEVGHSHGLKVMETSDLRPLVQVIEGEPNTFENFLSKFATLRLFYRSPDVIKRITREAIEDAAADNIRYLELRFTPVALSKVKNFPLSEVMDWVIEGAQKGERELGVKTRLIASVNRHESLGLAEEVIGLAIERKEKGIVGIDLAGSEATAMATPFIGLFREARESGLHITVHAGEWGGPDNVYEAISKFQTKRVGHGIRVMEDEKIIALAREQGTIFEVCITSNYQSGVTPVLSDHPLPRMLSAGLNVTLNSDDPSISQISLGDDYRQANEVLGIPLSVLRDQTIAAAKASFLPEDERVGLTQTLSEEYQQILPTH
jgi:adenosine deaminase